MTNNSNKEQTKTKHCKSFHYFATSLYDEGEEKLFEKVKSTLKILLTQDEFLTATVEHLQIGDFYEITKEQLPLDVCNYLVKELKKTKAVSIEDKPLLFSMIKVAYGQLCELLKIEQA